jgi:DNA-binding SARP family transcriptional activator
VKAPGGYSSGQGIGSGAFNPGPAVWFGILGGLQARRAAGDTRPVTGGPYKQRVLLGVLLCHANHVVSVDALSEALWGDELPRTASKNLQVLISTLRKGLSGGSAPALASGQPEPGTRGPEVPIRLLYRHPGYLIEAEPRQLDALRFRELIHAGRAAERAGDAQGAGRALGEAVGLWRGPTLPELTAVPIIAAEARRLREQYLDVYESWAEAELALGRHADLVEGLGELARRHPFRERLRSAQMLALYRSGRRAEALAQYEAMRQLLARELGLRPSPVLAQLYASLLSGDTESGARPGFPAPDRARPRAIAARGPAAAEPARVRLPRELTDFTGRRTAAAALLAVFGQAEPGRVAVLSGPAGVGKTALAVHFAYRLADQYPDARVLVRLRTPDGSAASVSEVLGELLHALAPGVEPPRGLNECAVALRERTAWHRMLFVLDDAVTEVQVRSVLWAIGDSAALVTSRRRLAGLEGATHLALGPLRQPEALELLGRLIGPARLAADPDGARRIATACGGLPLALRIAGAKLAGLRHLPLTRFAERLTDDRRLLDELSAGDLRIRPALALAHQDLSPGDQAALEGLSRASGSCFTAAEAAALLGTAVAQAESAIERLIEAHLMEALPIPGFEAADELSDEEEEDDVFAHCAEPLYRLLPLIRVFVRERQTR